MEYLLTKDAKGKFRYVILDSFWNEDKSCYIVSRITSQYKGKETQQPYIEIYKGKAKRTVTEQKNLEYQSCKKKFLDKGYKEVEKHPNDYTEEKLHELYGSVTTNQYGTIKPMLAKQADKVTNKKIYDKEWIASRKIDGTRCLMYYNPEDDTIHSASRGGEHYDAATSHLREDPVLREIFHNMPHLILDGELYKHGKSLQQISGAARMEKNAYDCDWLEYYVYDCIDLEKLDMVAKDRINLLKSIQDSYGFGFDPMREWKEGELQIQFVPQVPVTGWKNMEKLHAQYVEEGFEGLVIRNPDRPYKPNGRTNDMLKFKQYKSAEWKVIDYQLGTRGSEDMCFICELEDGRTFAAMPVGDRATKEEYVQNFESKYKGHMLECTYFNLSDDGIPTQPKGRIFRFDLE